MNNSVCIITQTSCWKVSPVNGSVAYLLLRKIIFYIWWQDAAKIPSHLTYNLQSTVSTENTSPVKHAVEWTWSLWQLVKHIHIFIHIC